MESIFINSIKNELTKSLVEKVLTIFYEIQEKDSAMANLLVEYLIKQIKYNLLSIYTSKSTQTDSDETDNGWDMKDITNEVKQVAEQSMNQTGLNYDKTSGTYYNSEEGYYYIPDYRLYYYPRLSAYYYYDETTDSLKFHSSVTSGDAVMNVANEGESSLLNCDKPKSTTEEESIKDKMDDKFGRFSPRSGKIEEKEEGELSTSEEEEETMESCSAKVVFESGPKAFAPDHSKHNAPCMRMVIVKTDLENYPAGTLFLLTRDGGTLGREGAHHEILLPDTNVSKEHLKFHYVYKGDNEQRYAYEVIDLGSKNGTWVNGKRLSISNKESDPEEISHGTVIRVGSSTLLCHIHNGMDSCSECQTVEMCDDNNVTGCDSTSNLSTRQLYHKQLMQLKNKYQLHGTMEMESTGLPKGYLDRAKVRRDTVGSSHHSEKIEMASVDVPMSKKNKGYNLLSKMGWKEGDNLGKNSTASVQEPLYVEPKIDKAGFGA